MFGLRHKTTTTTYGVIIDVGSGSVGVGIVKSDHQKSLPEILFIHRVPMRMAVTEDKAGEYMRRMREALFSAMLVLAKDGLKILREHDKHAVVRRILVTCSSPWSQTISKKVTYTHDTKFEVTKTLIAELVKNTEKEMAKDFDETALIGSAGLRIVERATVNYEVNDYSIQDPVGLLGANLSLFHMTGLVPEEIIDAVHEVQEKILTNTELSVHTFMLIIYCVLRDLFPEQQALTIVDVTGESTEIAIVNDGILVDSICAPYGSSTLVREIAKASKSSLEDVVSELRAFSERTSHDEAYKKMSTYLASYTVSLVETIQKITADRILPRTMVITASPEFRNLFSGVIPEIAHEATGSQFTILELKKNILSEIATSHNTDVFITIASRFFHKLHGCGEFKTL